ncbi:MAG: SHOCT domain-containing protein [Calditrichaeota bacterium]|nr:SHOCT domain-containing protein [Calditrichota bacterium]
MMFGMGVFGILFWIAVIGLVIWGINQITQSSRQRQLPGGRPPADESPLGILKQRYARGEISKEQFEQMKRELRA